MNMVPSEKGTGICLLTLKSENVLISDSDS